jgi:AcrR family transcriptional regulator
VDEGRAMVTHAKFQARGLARRQAILDAARELFMEKGFEQTSLTDIVDRSKGSRRTLYEHFGNKEGLLRAIIAEGTARVEASLNIPDENGAPTEEYLFAIGHSFFHAVMNPANIAMLRIVIAEGARIPGLADLFYNSGPHLVRQRLTRLFRQGQEQGDFQGGAPEDLAQAFVGLILGDFHMRRAIGREVVLTDEQAEAHVRRSIRIFLNGARGECSGRGPSA